MTDLSKLVDYTKPHAVHIKNPVTDEDIGVVFNVISMNSARVIAASREYERFLLAEKAAGREVDDYEKHKGFLEARLVAAIDSWDWGGASFGDLGSDPECNDENKSYIVSHENADWIREQLVDGVVGVENFTQVYPKPARNTSRKK